MSYYFWMITLMNTAWNVRIQSYSGPYFPALGLNANQNNPEYSQFLRSERMWIIFRKQKFSHRVLLSICLFANFVLALLIKVLLIKQACTMSFNYRKTHDINGTENNWFWIKNLESDMKEAVIRVCSVKNVF